MTHKWVGNPDFAKTAGRMRHQWRPANTPSNGPLTQIITIDDLYSHEKHTRILLQKLQDKFSRMEKNKESGGDE
jgi:hypothetical protein